MARGVLVAYIMMACVSIGANFLPIPVYLHMIAITTLIIYIASFNAAEIHGDVNSEVVQETLKTSDAYMFPVTASCVLFSLYLAFKFLPKYWINIVIKTYFFIFGVIVMGQRVRGILAKIMPSGLVDSLERKYKVITFPEINLPEINIPFLTGTVDAKSDDEKAPLIGDDKDKFKLNDNQVKLSLVDVLGYLTSAGVSVWYLMTEHWLASNCFGIAFSLQGIELLSLGSFFNGFVLLNLLFFYDIFWVFGTDVMVTVAKSFDAPIKLLFPQTAGLRPSMLGLGDIVIPGIFIAMMLRFDKKRHLSSGKGTSVKPLYFWMTLFWYFLGLSTTVMVMYHFKAAQPALLYLVPACLGAPMGFAVIRGEFMELWKYTEDPEKETDKVDAQKTDDAKKTE